VLTAFFMNCAGGGTWHSELTCKPRFPVYSQKLDALGGSFILLETYRTNNLVEDKYRNFFLGDP